MNRHGRRRPRRRGPFRIHAILEPRSSVVQYRSSKCTAKGQGRERRERRERATQGSASQGRRERNAAQTHRKRARGSTPPSAAWSKLNRRPVRGLPKGKTAPATASDASLSPPEGRAALPRRAPQEMPDKHKDASTLGRSPSPLRWAAVGWAAVERIYAAPAAWGAA